MDITSLTLLIAADARWKHLGDKFRTVGTDIPPSSIVTGVLVFAAVAALLWLLGYMISRRESRPHINSPRALFRELCRAHQLKSAQQRLLRSVAERKCAAHPAELFIEPQFLLAAADDVAFRSRRAELLALRSRLFDGEESH